MCVPSVELKNVNGKILLSEHLSSPSLRLAADAIFLCASSPCVIWSDNVYRCTFAFFHKNCVFRRCARFLRPYSVQLFFISTLTHQDVSPMPSTHNGLIEIPWKIICEWLERQFRNSNNDTNKNIHSTKYCFRSSALFAIENETTYTQNTNKISFKYHPLKRFFLSFSLLSSSLFLVLSFRFVLVLMCFLNKAKYINKQHDQNTSSVLLSLCVLLAFWWRKWNERSRRRKKWKEKH